MQIWNQIPFLHETCLKSNYIKDFNSVKLTKSNLKWWIIVAISPCLAIIYINQTAVSITLPQLQIDFGMSEVMQQWVVNAYILALAALITVGGKISDIIGNRRAFLFGLSGFLIASLLCGAAINGAALIISRVLQGIFGAILIPNTTVVVINAFPPNERGKAIGVYVGFSSIFLAIGPLIGGIFTQFLTWRLVYWINIPFGLFSLLIAFRVMSKKKPVITQRKIDWISVVASTIATCALIISLMEAVDFGWNSPLIIGLFVLSVLSYIFYFIYETTSATPLVNLAILKERVFLIAGILIFCTQLCTMAVVVFFTVFSQVGLGFSPTMAGLVTMPATAMNMIFAPIAGMLFDRFGPRLPVISGLALVTIGLFAMSAFALLPNYWFVICGTIIVGIGLPLTSAPVFTQAITTIVREHRGTATGLYNQIRQIGGAFGIAVIGATITNIDNRYFKKLLLLQNLPTYIESSVDSILSGTTGAEIELAQFPNNIAVKIHDVAVIAYTNAFRYGMLVAGFFALIAVIIAITKFKNIKV